MQKASANSHGVYNMWNEQGMRVDVDHIRYQYDDIEQSARAFRHLSDSAEDILRRTLYCLRQMDNGVWIGRGADEYRDELEDIVIPAVRRLAAVLGDAAWTLDKTADIMREADELAAAQFKADGRPLNVQFDSVFLSGSTFGGGADWTPGEIRRLGDVFGGGGGGGRLRDDLAAVNNVNNDESLRRRFGREFFNQASDIINSTPRNPDVPPALPGPNGPVVTPPWFTEHSTEDGGLNGSADSPVLVAGAGDHNRLLGDIAQTSGALGGAQVSGMFALEEGAVRGPGAIAPGASISTVTPAVQALMDWVREHPNGLFILPPWSVAHGADALNALAAEGFDISNLKVVVVGETGAQFPDGASVRVIKGLPDLRG